MTATSLLPYLRFSVLLLFAALPFLTACKKDGETGNSLQGDYFMRFKANGALVEYNDQLSLTAAFGQTNDQYNAALTGYDASSNLSLQVYDNKPIEETTYSDYQLVGSIFIGCIIGYQDDGGTLYLQAVPAPDLTVTISELNAENVRGTFSGTLYASGMPDMVISEGEFSLARIN